MKIAIFDSYAGKFSRDMQDWWMNRGYEVVRDTYYDPDKVQWADVVWFETCDNNILSATNPSEALLAASDTKLPWSLHDMDLTNKKVIVRPIDIEVWQGHHAHDNMWNVVDDVIFLAPHIHDIFNADSRTQGHKFKQHVIPAGVNTDKFNFHPGEKNNKIGIVAERWVSKGIDLCVQLAMALPDYEFYWLGKNNDYHWQEAYLQDMVQNFCPNLHLEEEYVEDLNEWWEDKSFVLSCSYKETYGYNIAEAMSKGIKPIIHRFYGADAIWPGLTWTRIDQAIERIRSEEYKSTYYREYLFEHHLDLASQMLAFEKVING